MLTWVRSHIRSVYMTGTILDLCVAGAYLAGLSFERSVSGSTRLALVTILILDVYKTVFTVVAVFVACDLLVSAR